MEARFGMAGGLRGKDKKESPADGPARVVKPGDWGAVAESGMRGFPMAAFSVPGRAQPKPSAAETRLQDMAREARKAEDAHKLALAKAVSDGEDAVRTAMAKGREEGLREGEARALEKYEASIRELRDNASQAMGSFAREKDALFLEFEGNVLELVSAAIHRIFDGLAKEHAEAVLPLVRKAVSALGQAAAITLKVNPGDFKVVESNQDFWLPVDTGSKDIRVVADDRIPKGGCFVESDSTSVALLAGDLADRIDEELKKVFTAKADSLKRPEDKVGETGDLPS